MKITLQTLKSVKYEIEVKDTDTVAEIKQRAEKEHDIGEAASMKLIHQGKILKDTQTIADAKIKAGDFLVVMVSAKRTATAATPAATAPTPAAPAKTAATTATTPSPAPVASTPAPTEVKATPTPTPVATSAASSATTSTTAGATPTAGAYQSAASTLVMGSAYEDSIASLMGLGFSHSMVVAALKASYNTPDRAADYLFSGKTEAELQAMAAAATGAPGMGGAGRGATPVSPPTGGATPTSPTAGVTPPVTGTPTGATGAAALAAQAAAAQANNPMAALAGPEFAALRGMIQENPQIVPYLLQQLAQTNPGLMQAMGQNPQAVMSMFGQAMGLPGATAAGRGAATGATPTAAGRGTAGRGALPPGMVAGPGGTIGVTITPEEKAILDRLEALGYSRQKVLEAFLLCDRSEEAAANYLMDHGMDQMDEFQD